MKQYNIRSTCTRWFETTATHWISRRLSTCFSTIESGAREQSKVSETDGVPNLGGEHIGKDGEIIPKGMRYVSKEFYNTMRSGKIKIDDLLLVKDGATIGKIVCVKKMPYPDCSINEHVYILRTENNVCSQYIYYLFRSIPIQDQIWLNVRGSAQPGLTQQFLKSIAIYLPLIEEQNRIARYLDYKNHLINKYIRIKKKQIELLKELKQAIINDAVTGKIDVRTGKPYPKYKDSGVDLLGMIPEEWEISRMRNVCYLQRGYDLSHDKFVEGKYPVMGSNGIIGFHNRNTTKSPNITVGRSGSVGKVTFVETDFWAHNTCLFVLHNYGNDWKWIYYFFCNFDMSRVSEGSAVPTLNRNNVHRSFIAFPDVKCQSKIVEYIERVSNSLDKSIDAIKSEISLIQELQTRLISDVVTGKLDVRDIEVPDLLEEEFMEELEGENEDMEEADADD